MVTICDPVIQDKTIIADMSPFDHLSRCSLVVFRMHTAYSLHLVTPVLLSTICDVIMSIRFSLSLSNISLHSSMASIALRMEAIPHRLEAIASISLFQILPSASFSFLAPAFAGDVRARGERERRGGERRCGDRRGGDLCWQRGNMRGSRVKQIGNEATPDQSLLHKTTKCLSQICSWTRHDDAMCVVHLDHHQCSFGGVI